MKKVIDLSGVREEQDELETARLWDDAREAWEELYTWRGYEEFVIFLKAVEKVKTRIVR